MLIASSTRLYSLPIGPTACCAAGVSRAGTGATAVLMQFIMRSTRAHGLSMNCQARISPSSAGRYPPCSRMTTRWVLRGPGQVNCVVGWGIVIMNWYTRSVLAKALAKRIEHFDTTYRSVGLKLDFGETRALHGGQTDATCCGTTMLRQYVWPWLEKGGRRLFVGQKRIGWACCSVIFIKSVGRVATAVARLVMNSGQSIEWHLNGRV